MVGFIIKAKIIIIGYEQLKRSKSNLQFILLSEDALEKNKVRIMNEFQHYPIIQKFTSVEIQNYFTIKSAKVIGFKKSGLSGSVYKELKNWRVNGF